MSLTLIIIAVTCVVSLLAFSNVELIQRLILWPPAIAKRGEWWRLATCGLIHADGTHLLFNMVTLYFFGPQIEELVVPYIGPIGYVGFYVAALVVSSMPSYFQHKDDANYYSLGASGAVSAILFGFILMKPWAMLGIFFVVPVPAILYAVLYTAYAIYIERKGNSRINHSAHLWGAAFGIAFLGVMEPALLGQFFERLSHPRFR